MIGAEQVQGDGGGKLRFPILFGTKGDALFELPVAIFLYNTEKVADEPFLPVQQLERLVVIAALGVPQALDEHDGAVSFFLVIMRRRQHKPRRLVIIHMGSRSFRRVEIAYENIDISSSHGSSRWFGFAACKTMIIILKEQGLSAPCKDLHRSHSQQLLHNIVLRVARDRFSAVCGDNGKNLLKE